MRNAGVPEVGAAGYTVANALAEANLRLGRSVVADCVNPVRESRLGWQQVARQASAHLVDIHLTCDDAAEHRRRVEGRVADITGLAAPDWDAVMRHAFEPRDDNPLVLDTASLPPEMLVEQCLGHLMARSITLHPCHDP